MSKVTVITEKGGIVAIGHGHLSEKTSRKLGVSTIQAGLRAGPNQDLQELDLSEDVSKVAGWSELEAKVRPHIRH